MKNEGKELLDSAIDQLAKATDSEETRERVGAFLTSMSRFHTYSFGNQMLIAWQRPTATCVAGFETWKKVGRFVRKGEKGISILAPCAFAQKDDEDKVIRQGLFFRTVKVFAYEQTEGKELPKLHGRIEGDYSTEETALQNLCASLGIRVETVELGHGHLGTSTGGAIELSSVIESGRRVLVLAHEIAHELLHKGDDRKHTTQKDRETDAEAVAYVVGLHLGLTNPDAGAYLKLYGVDATQLRTRYASISKAVQTIIAGLKPARLAQAA